MSHQLRLTGLFLVLSTCLLFSCQSVTSDPEEQYTVTFSVSNYQQISFDDLSASGTRAVSSDHPTTLAHLLIAVFDAETGEQACTPIQHNQSDYTTEDKWDDYPKFSLTLPYGRYRILILGFNGSQKCNITSVNQISWENDYVPNTFYYCEEFTFDKNASLEQKITLKHVVTAFRIMTEDVAPAELKKARFISTAGGTVLDAMTGFTPQSTGRTSEITVPAECVGVKDTFTVYLFLPEEQITTNYTVQTFGKNDNVLYEKHFNDVPLRINVLTVWKGKFFETSSSDVEEQNAGISLYWDTQWADTLKL